MSDYFNDYPQTVGRGGADHFATAQQKRNAALQEASRSKNAFKLWKWARDLKDETGTDLPLPCAFADKQQDFIPQLEAYVRELFPVAYPGYQDSGLDTIFIDLGLEPITVGEK